MEAKNKIITLEETWKPGAGEYFNSYWVDSELPQNVENFILNNKKRCITKNFFDLHPWDSSYYTDLESKDRKRLLCTKHLFKKQDSTDTPSSEDSNIIKNPVLSNSKSLYSSNANASEWVVFYESSEYNSAEKGAHFPEYLGFEIQNMPRMYTGYHYNIVASNFDVVLWYSYTTSDGSETDVKIVLSWGELNKEVQVTFEDKIVQANLVGKLILPTEGCTISGYIYGLRKTTSNTIEGLSNTTSDAIVFPMHFTGLTLNNYQLSGLTKVTIGDCKIEFLA